RQVPVIARAHTYVVLEGELGAGTHLEARAFAAEGPDCRCGQMVDLVGRERAAPGEDQVAVMVRLDRVQVDVVPRTIGGGRRRHIRVAHRHVVEAVPLEQDESGGNIDLLRHTVHDYLVSGPV